MQSLILCLAFISLSHFIMIIAFATDRYKETAKAGLGRKENKRHSGPSFSIKPRLQEKISV